MKPETRGSGPRSGSPEALEGVGTVVLMSRSLDYCLIQLHAIYVKDFIDRSPVHGFPFPPSLPVGLDMPSPISYLSKLEFCDQRTMISLESQVVTKNSALLRNLERIFAKLLVF